MTLTPAILPFLADKPDAWVGRYAVSLLTNRKAGVATACAHRIAVEAADRPQEGRSPKRGSLIRAGTL